MSRQAPRAGRRARVPAGDGRRQLLDAAIELFAERGIANTTIAQIAVAGRVTAAMVHYWFDSREKLLDALVEERLAPLFHTVWDPVPAHHETPEELVAGVVHRLFQVTSANTWVPSLWMREIINEGGLLRERALRHVPLDRVAAFAMALAKARHEGEFNPDIEPWVLLLSILALVMVPQATGRLWQRLNPQASLDLSVLERHVTGLLLHGIAAPTPASRKAPTRATSPQSKVKP
ncbi:MAG TPA: TetR/AcrR family transcriptional regulator [Steroidobacteraceae bacterium]|nr:TetR/AcrR family transcriptional regulator [Steroidobacteraceae bacterium]